MKESSRKKERERRESNIFFCLLFRSLSFVDACGGDTTIPFIMCPNMLQEAVCFLGYTSAYILGLSFISSLKVCYQMIW